MSFHLEEFGEFKAGDVVRLGNAAQVNINTGERLEPGPFMDAVVLGFNENGQAKLSRPYVYASSVGTTGPTPLLGAETFTTNLTKYDRVIDRGRIT